MSLLLPATLFLAIAAPGAAAPGITIELPASLSHDEAHILLAGVRAGALDICRRENRHGAMAARSTRLCTADLVRRTVETANRPALTEVHEESSRRTECPNMAVRVGERR